MGPRARQCPVDQALEFFTRFYLQDDILMKVDRAAMMMLAGNARGVPRQRSRRVLPPPADTASSCAAGQRKYLLKKVARRLLPRRDRRPQEEGLWHSACQMAARGAGRAAAGAAAGHARQFCSRGLR